MKQKLFFALISIALGFVGCVPRNPPSADKTTAIIDLCYSSMGKSGEKLQKDLMDLGIEIEKTAPYKEYECYYIKTNSYELAFSTINDSVLILRYRIDFKNTYVNGANKFVEISDFVFNYGWDAWSGSASSSHTDRAAYLAEIADWVPTWDSIVLELSEFAAKNLNDGLKLVARPVFWAESVGGRDHITGKRRSSIANTSITINFEIK